MNRREEKAFWEARPELRHVRDYARARRATPFATLGVTLARVVAATPHEWLLPNDGCLNLFVGLVGAPGSGKGKSTLASRRAVQMADAKVVPVGSGEGIAHQLAFYEKPNPKLGIAGGIVRTNFNLIIDIPEIDTMASIGGRSGSTLLPELRKAWSGEPLGMGYANREKALIIEEHSYRIALVAGIQPGRAGALLRDADGGTPQRFLWMPVGDPDAPEVRPIAPAPIQWTVPKPRRGFGQLELSVCAAALQEVDDFELQVARGEASGHEAFARLKVAAAIGLLNGRASVNEEDWQLSQVVMDRSNETQKQVVDQLEEVQLEEARQRGRNAHASNEAFQDIDRNISRVSAAMLKKLAAAKGGLPGNELRSAIAYRDRKPWFEKALNRLLSEGSIAKEPAEHGAIYHATKRK